MDQVRNSQVPWLIVGNACLMGFAVWIPTYCVPPMEHIIKTEFLLTHTEASLLFASPSLMLMAVGFPGGFIADRIGAKRAIGIGVIIMVIGATLRGIATSTSSLLSFTLIYGVGLGLSFPNLPKMISGWVSPKKVGMALGIYSAAMFAGEALALAITVPLIFPITHSIQGVFLMCSAPLVVAAIAWWILVKDPPHLSIERDPASRIGVSLYKVLRNQNIWLLAGLYLIICFFYNSWIGWSPALLILKGASPDLAGLMTSMTLWIGIPAALIIPRISDRTGLRKPFLWGGMITLAICAWAAMDVSILFSWPLMAVVGIALTSTIPIIFAIPVEMIHRDSVGTASGLVISIGMIGSSIGPLIGGRILDLTGNLDLSLILLVVISAVATGIAFRLPETGPKARNK